MTEEESEIHDTAGFEDDGKGLEPRNIGHLQELTRKGREMDSHLELPERNASLLCLDFSLGRPFVRCLIYRTIRQ